MGGKAMNGNTDAGEVLGRLGAPYASGDHFDKSDAWDLVKWLRGAASSIEDSGVEANATLRGMVRSLVSAVNQAQRAKHIADTTEVQEAPKAVHAFDGQTPPPGWVLDPNTLRYGPPASAKDVAALGMRVAALERMFDGPVYRETLEEARKRARALLGGPAESTPLPPGAVTLAAGKDAPAQKPHNPHEIPSGWEQLHHLKQQQDAERAKATKDGDQPSA